MKTGKHILKTFEICCGLMERLQKDAKFLKTWKNKKLSEISDKPAEIYPKKWPNFLAWRSVVDTVTFPPVAPRDSA